MCLSLPLCLSFVILFLVLLKYRRYKKLQAAAPGAALWLPLTFRHECVVPRMRQQSHSSCYARHAPSTCEAVFPRYRSLPKQKRSSFKVHLFLFLSLPPPLSLAITHAHQRKHARKYAHTHTQARQENCSCLVVLGSMFTKPKEWPVSKLRYLLVAVSLQSRLWRLMKSVWWSRGTAGILGMWGFPRLPSAVSSSASFHSVLLSQQSATAEWAARNLSKQTFLGRNIYPSSRNK